MVLSTSHSHQSRTQGVDLAGGRHGKNWRASNKIRVTGTPENVEVMVSMNLPKINLRKDISAVHKRE